MKSRKTSVLLPMALIVAGTTVLTAVKGGHEIPIYPSYYPHEIELAAVAPQPAADLLRAGKIHAYIGGAPRFTNGQPDSIGSIESLGTFVIVRVNRSSLRVRDESSACAIVETVIRDLAGGPGGLIVHPYPVTPFHGDYLQHVDLAESARRRILDGRADGSAAENLKVKAANEWTNALVRPPWRAQGAEWDVEIAQVSAAQLVSQAVDGMNGWLGPAWLKKGWFHAYLLLGGEVGNADVKRRVESQFRRLESSDNDTPVERINRERSLVTALAGDCYVRVAGYTVKREYFSTVFSAGIENIGFDSMTGLNSPMFVRTVKLRDFPWNGWLALGIAGSPAAAWNPIAGFTDDFGRLTWSAVGDPASVPSPYDAAWIFNRVSDVQSGSKQ